MRRNSPRVEPRPGQESVWDYPRPPRLEPCSRLIQVRFNNLEIARTTRSLRVLETSHPPVFYLPPDDVRMDCLTRTGRSTGCEFKGRAVYFDLRVGDVVTTGAAWSYPSPLPRYAALRDHLAFYPGAMEECLVDGERAAAQVGDFYGGWITSGIVGPFKGPPDTWGW